MIFLHSQQDKDELFFNVVCIFILLSTLCVFLFYVKFYACCLCFVSKYSPLSVRILTMFNTKAAVMTKRQENYQRTDRRNIYHTLFVLNVKINGKFCAKTYLIHVPIAFCLLYKMFLTFLYLVRKLGFQLCRTTITGNYSN